MSIYQAQSKGKMYIGASKVKKAYQGATKVYSSGNTVTYIVDGTNYQEEFDEGESCFSPKTFTPAKSGWTFVGWRTDSAASGSVLSSKVMGDDPITLYAVFRKLVTVTYYNGSITASSTSGYRYYNNGNTVNPSFTLNPATLHGWAFRGWAASSAAEAGIAYSSISNTEFSASATVYAAYYQTITLSYDGNGSTSGSTPTQAGTRYYNTGNYSNPSFTLASNGFSKLDHTFQKWAYGSAGGTQYAAGASVTLSGSTTFYAVWMAESLTVFAKTARNAAPTVDNSDYCTISTGSTNVPGALITMPSKGYVKFEASNRGGGEDNGYSYIQVSLGVYKKAIITLVPHFVVNDEDMADNGGVSNWIEVTGAATGDGTYGVSDEGADKTLTMTSSGTIIVKHNTGWKGDNKAEYWLKSIVMGS